MLGSLPTDTIMHDTVPIRTLPPEILAVILAMVVQSDREYTSATTGWTNRVKITSVCRFWRSIALELPELWSSISLLPAQGVEELIARSRDHPLSIRLHLSSQLESWDAISHHHHTTLLSPERLGEFYLQDHRDLFAPYWDLLPKVHAPVLRTLAINLLSKKARLPTHVLSASKPVLQHLSLNSCEVDWEGIRSLTGSNDLGIRNLRTLSLASLLPRLPKDIIESILLSSPSLRSLTLTMVLPHGFDPSRVWPCIQDIVPSLFVKDTLEVCADTAAFLSGIPSLIRTQPRFTTPPLIASGTPSTPNVPPRTSDETQDITPSATRPSVIASITIDGDSTLVQLRHRYKGPIPVNDDVVRIHGIYSSRGTFDEIVQNLFRAPETITHLLLSLPSVSIGIPSIQRPLYPAWLAFVATLRNAEEVDVTRGYEILHSLVYPLTSLAITSPMLPDVSDADADAASRILPALRVIRLCDCVIPEAETFQSHLKVILDARRHSGATNLARIELAGCRNVDEWLVESLRNVFGKEGTEIVWDRSDVAE